MSPVDGDGAWHKAWRRRSTRAPSEADGGDGDGVEANSERP